MNNLAPQFSNPYIGKRNCGTDASLVIPLTLLLAILVDKLYNEQVHTSHKHADSVFISRPLRAARIRKWLSAMDCVNNESSFLMEIKP
jgi:hypothetical protein